MGKVLDFYEIVYIIIGGVFCFISVSLFAGGIYACVKKRRNRGNVVRTKLRKSILKRISDS